MVVCRVVVWFTCVFGWFRWLFCLCWLIVGFCFGDCLFCWGCLIVLAFSLSYRRCSYLFRFGLLFVCGIVWFVILVWLFGYIDCEFGLLLISCSCFCLNVSCYFVCLAGWLFAFDCLLCLCWFVILLSWWLWVIVLIVRMCVGGGLFVFGLLRCVVL